IMELACWISPSPKELPDENYNLVLSGGGPALHLLSCRSRRSDKDRANARQGTSLQNATQILPARFRARTQESLLVGPGRRHTLRRSQWQRLPNRAGQTRSAQEWRQELSQLQCR